MLKAGGPSGGLQKTKRVGGGQVGTIKFMDSEAALIFVCTIHLSIDSRPHLIASFKDGMI